MKTRDDYIESIFEKRDKYIAERRKMRKTAMTFCIPITACIAVGTVVIFGSLRADTAKSLDYAAGSSLNGDILMEDCISPDESGQYSYNEKDETYKYDDGVLKEGCEPAADSESARDSAGSGETLSTTVMCEATAQNTKPADKGTYEGAGNDGLQMTIAGHTTVVDSSTTAPVTTTSEAAANKDTFVKYASVSVSSGTGWTYSSEKDYGSFDKAFIWVIEGGLDKLPDIDKPTGDVYTISLALSDGSSRVFKWSGNSLCDESGKWKAISDSRSEAIKYAVQND